MHMATRDWRWIPVVLVLTVLSACGSGQAPGPGAHGAGPPPAEVTVSEVTERMVAPADEFTGRIESSRSVEVRARVNGYIESVRYKEGSDVKVGDVLFVIDQRPYRADLSKALADLELARSQAALTQSQADRAKQLLDAHAISREEHDQRLAAASQAQASVHAAEAAVQTAKLNLDFTEVRTPINGRAGQAQVTAGNLVTANTTLLTTVRALDPLYVYFQGDEQTFLRYSARLRAGGEKEPPRDILVGLANEEGFPHKARFDFVENSLDSSTGTMRGRAVLDNHDRVFTPGLFVRVKTNDGGPQKAVVVDQRAILTDQDRRYVWVIGPENRAERRDVKLGRSVDQMVIVSDGLKPGEKIVVEGVQKVLFPGMPVITQGSQSPATAPAR